ncbi:bZIP transcription factor 12-like [Solanum dulcamara]|uniref:bZIP transcription factor 12-like n=1 Tax=Solanum dulcamara TaxID=45834 RepID=UPI002485D548|nr:bZIP transcription factor 12-like [Solanum dulcamara]
MASKVMPSASRTPNSDPSLHPQNPTSSLHHSLPSTNFDSMNMDEILNNIYSDSDPFACSAAPPTPFAPAAGGDVGNTKTVDEVWREIVAGGGNREPEMTLEDFLTKAGAVTEEDVRVPVIAPPPPPPPATEAPSSGGFVVDNMMGTGNCQFPVAMQNGPGVYGMEPQPHMGFGNGVVAITGSGSGSGRGKRRSTVEELPADRATQQKQRRMIKNRESAARSRERKQAYTVELVSLVTQLEEENARLLREEEEKNKERLKQIMENLIPVVEKQRPPRLLRRVRSMSW